MAVNCGVSFGVCAVRLTKLTSTGAVAAPPDNSYVSDKAISITVTPNIETGNTFSVRNGCGCSISRRKFADVFNWFEFSFNMAALEPEMLAMLLSAETVQASFSPSSDVIGLAFPSALACDVAEPAVALEFWTEHVVGSGRDGAYPYFHWAFPSTIWQFGDNTFEEGPAQPTVNGFSRTNQQWGEGPYGDGPPDDQDIREGGFWKTAIVPPAALCEAVNVTPSS